MRTLGRLRWSTWCGRLLDARPARERRTHPNGRLTALRRRGPLARLLGSRGSSWLAFGATDSTTRALGSTQGRATPTLFPPPLGVDTYGQPRGNEKGHPQTPPDPAHCDGKDRGREPSPVR